ncbi:xylose isomerase-like TIM barrel [Oceanimonas sp. GK1]|uniref:sugar phosphate isomerase/epimerase family protein n=1 Tax=Oceanimonas sp. (strain GK1 / IBRC-M 10197) TaxID=511062 RepID=UPI0002494B5F|nr:sugar phosphate isomerase/epimerase family protein [Oceanimonas sp. GK1]AEY00473.1 xylose isomerase-like TIM barrel [Oceanimonas sp. GK1]
MELALCTISFRHHLVSLAELALWARNHGFSGIELWGAHARNLAAQPQYNADWLGTFGLRVPMLSDYLPTEGPAAERRRQTQLLCDLAERWGAPRLRTFAGRKGSAETSPAERAAVVAALREQCLIAADHGLRLLVETHPGTLADGGESILRLLEEVNHPAFGLNFDTLHVWEGGDDPLTLLAQTRPHVDYFHLKNVSDRERLAVFAPGNVYAAAGCRDGMVPLFEGCVDYRAFLAPLLNDPDASASLEWFGPDAFTVLRQDRLAIRELGRPLAACG